MAIGSRGPGAGVHAAWLPRLHLSRKSWPSRSRTFVGWVWVCAGNGWSAIAASWHQFQQVVDGVGFSRGLVGPDAVDAREAHGDSRLVARRAADAVEGDLQHQL